VPQLTFFGKVSRQSGSRARGAKLPKVKETKLKPVYRATAQRVKIRWGPIILPASNALKPKGRTMDPNGFSWSGTIDGVPKGATVLMAQGQMVNEDGTPVGINNK
jgi:hypothetical protein